jgi:hypothetical protein
MVRRDDSSPPEGQPTEGAESRCICPAGERPVRVIAGEPGSRPAPEAQRPTGGAWCRKPLAAKAVRGEQQRGPQHQVKPATSTDRQSESRAKHVGAKAMSAARESGCAVGLGGVWGAARAEGEMRNTGDPSQQPLSRRGSAYKPMVKAQRVERESEGAVIPTMGAPHNAPGGRGPCSGRASAGGTTGKPYAGNPHVRFERRRVETGC